MPRRVWADQRQGNTSEMLRTLALVAALFCSGAVGEVDDGWRVVGRLLDDCGGQGDVASCMASKAVAFFDRAARAEVIPLGDQVSLVKAHDARESRALSEEELGQARSQGKLTDLLWDRMASFLDSHTIKIDLPKMSSQELQRSMEEGSFFLN